MRFAGEGIQGEGNQALLEDVSDRALQGRQPRLPPAIRDTRAAPPLQLETPAPRNAEKPLVLDVTADDPPRNAADGQPQAVEVFEVQDQQSQTKPHKQSVEEASAAVMNSLLSRDQARAAKAAAKAKAKAEAKAAAKEATKADPKAAGTKAGAKAAGKVKPKAKAKPKAAPPAEVPVETIKTPSKKRLATDPVEDSSMFRIDHEKSIPQWLLRTGWKKPFGPGSKGFRYIRGDEASEKQMLKECHEFAKKLCLERSVASPAL